MLGIAIARCRLVGSLGGSLGTRRPIELAL
jgi:hypothetical protein